jgi:hypothetical protein
MLIVSPDIHNRFREKADGRQQKTAIMSVKFCPTANTGYDMLPPSKQPPYKECRHE